MNATSMLRSLSLLGVLGGLGMELDGYAATPAPGSSGSIVITDHQLNPALSSFQKDLKSEAKASLAKNPDTENWKIHFIAYMNRQPGSEDVNVVFYDQQPLKPGQPREPVQAYPIKTKATAKIVMSQLDLKPEDGFKAGGKYEVLVTRLMQNGKEEVYARGNVALTDK